MYCEEINNEIVDCFYNYLQSHLVKENYNYIMSSEGFSGNPYTGYKNTSIVASHINKVLSKIDTDVKIIVYLRRQDDFVESLYTQSVLKDAHHSFDDFINSLPASAFDWYSLLSCYANFFGKENIIVRRYDKNYFLQSNTNLLKDFLASLNFNSEEFLLENEIIQPNRGYNRESLEIARLCNSYLDDDEKILLGYILQHVSAKFPFEPYFFFNKKDRMTFLSKYFDSNRKVLKEYFHDDKTDVDLFPSIITINNEHYRDYQGLSLEEAIPILVKAILYHELVSMRFLRVVERKLIAWLKKFPRLFSRLQELGGKLGM